MMKKHVSPHKSSPAGQTKGKRMRPRTVNQIELEENHMLMDRISLLLVIVGALNWGSVGLFRFDLVAWIFGSQAALGSRIVYTAVALAGLWCISLLFRDRDERVHEDMM